ncbi:unnamed protein product, partial [Litomosoides sigmodontis]
MRFLESIYRHYGRYVAKHPTPFLLTPVIMTLLLTIGLPRFHIDNDIWNIYSPVNGLSRAEEEALKRFEYASSAHHYRLQILVNRKDGGDLMNDNNTDEMLRMARFIVKNVTVADGMKILTYHNICGVYCNESNDAVLTFIKDDCIDQRLSSAKFQAAIDNNGRSSPSLAFTFPKARIFGRHIFMGYSVGELHYSKYDVTIVDGFKLFIFHFMVNLNLPNGVRIAKIFESQLRTLLSLANEKSKDLEYFLFSRDREIEEQSQITLASLPFLGVTTLVLTAFMIISLIDFPFENSQYIEAIFAVISPGMALITSWGILWGIGLPFSNILTVVPFLVVTIGVDDAFLILAAWRQSNTACDLETRMGETLTHSGTSVTITSLTDVLCFTVGLFSNLPVVRLFCIYTSVAIMIDFIYQITFFTAIVAYTGKQRMGHLEKKDHKPKNVLNGLWSKIEQKDLHKLYPVDFATTKYCINGGDSLSAKMLQKAPKKSEIVVQKFVNILHLPFIKFLVIATFITHIIVVSYLCTEVNTDFDMGNLYLENSCMNAISRQLQRFTLSETFVVNFALYPMPNFADVLIRNEFNRLIEELETIPNFGMGSAGTVLWTRDFADAVEFWDGESNLWLQDKLLSTFREYEMEEKFIIT